MWATGNGGLTDDDCNCDGYTTSIYTISIGCISDHGLSTYYTELCASTLAVTFNGGAHREREENKMVRMTFQYTVIFCHFFLFYHLLSLADYDRFISQTSSFIFYHLLSF